MESSGSPEGCNDEGFFDIEGLGILFSDDFEDLDVRVFCALPMLWPVAALLLSLIPGEGASRLESLTSTLSLVPDGGVGSSLFSVAMATSALEITLSAGLEVTSLRLLFPDLGLAELELSFPDLGETSLKLPGFFEPLPDLGVA